MNTVHNVPRLVIRGCAPVGVMYNETMINAAKFLTIATIKTMAYTMALTALTIRGTIAFCIWAGAAISEVQAKRAYAKRLNAAADARTAARATNPHAHRPAPPAARPAAAAPAAPLPIERVSCVRVA